MGPHKILRTQVSPSPVWLGKAGTEKGGTSTLGAARSDINVWESDLACQLYCFMGSWRANEPRTPGFGAGTLVSYSGLNWEEAVPTTSSLGELG